MQPAEDRYDALTDEVAALYDAGRQADALALMDAGDDDLTPWSAELAHLRACLLGSLGQTQAALAVLRKESEAGGWWAEPILTDDDDLAGLQSLPEFQEVVALSRQRRNTDPTPPLVHLGTQPTRVVVALHGAGQRATHAARDWSGVLELGCALICVESSQLMSPMYRTWPDRQAARDDIARALTQLPEELRGLPLIAAGFSAGGRAALDWALTGLPQRADGVLALAPALRELPQSAANPLSPATILIGTDDDLLDVVTSVTPELTGLGVIVRQLPGVAHHRPADFGTLLADHLS
ncbi:alpha/beta hydrolase [Kribbella sp. CA-253562]|uniref:alpha/beta hydrolase n=1 Tax=Kribbella sp. CA-253562 TaxID=3239942 RepID=UPI003D94493A